MAVLYAGVPVALKLGVAALLFRFRLTERAQRAIRSRLERDVQAYDDTSRFMTLK